MEQNSLSGAGGQVVREVGWLIRREDIRHVNVTDDLYHAPHSCMRARPAWWRPGTTGPGQRGTIMMIF